MSRDEALLVNADALQPVLRFYSWSQPCLSLGYHQKTAAVDRNFLRRSGIAAVRRPTGGRAVLHEHELTYSLTMAVRPGPEGSVPAVCRMIHGIIAEALQLAGLHVEMEKTGSGAGTKSNPICFSLAAESELKSGGKKIIGSAQVRRNGKFMQHGSIPFFFNRKKLTHIFSLDPLLAQSVGDSLPDGSLFPGGKPPDIPRLQETVAEKLAARLNLPCSPSDYSGAEKAEAEKLKKKYACPQWTWRI